MNEKLKPCPFCGGEASVIKTLCLKNNYEGYFVQHPCDMTIAPIKTSSFATEQQAIATWNRRSYEQK